MPFWLLLIFSTVADATEGGASDPQAHLRPFRDEPGAEAFARDLKPSRRGGAEVGCRRTAMIGDEVKVLPSLDQLSAQRDDHVHVPLDLSLDFQHAPRIKGIQQTLPPPPLLLPVCTGARSSSIVCCDELLISSIAIWRSLRDICDLRQTSAHSIK
jgi:hypothetical protein